jgi:hypothetical protein
MEEEAVPANAVRGVGVEWIEKRIFETGLFLWDFTDSVLLSVTILP